MIVVSKQGSRFVVVSDDGEWVILRPDTPEADIANMQFTIAKKVFTEQFEEVSE